MNFNIFLSIFLFFIIFIYLFTQLGNFIDISQNPTQADIIVSLGGDRGCRLKETLKLYKQGLSSSKKVIYTGSDSINKNISKSKSRKLFFYKHGIKKKNIIHISHVSNTMEELFFIRQYMLKYHYKSVLIISHPFHSRRILTLAKYIAKYQNYNLKIKVTSCYPSGWDKKYFFLTKANLIITISETIKIIYNLIKYSPLFIKFTPYYYKEKNNLIKNFIQKLN